MKHILSISLLVGLSSSLPPAPPIIWDDITPLRYDATDDIIPIFNSFNQAVNYGDNIGLYVSTIDPLPTVYGIMTIPARRDAAVITQAATRNDLMQFEKLEIDCLALNIYHESRGEGRIGMVAVGWTTINRRDSPKFPDTICKVVYQPSQFSWINEGYSTIYENAAYDAVFDAATFLYKNYETVNDYTGGSLYFLSPMQNPPSWSRKFKTTFTYRRHTFYRP